MSRLLFTADTHLSHGRIREYCNRSFSSTREMDDTLLSNISSMVKGDTTLYFLGDIAMNPIAIPRFLEAVKCPIIFITGNHDKKRHLKLLAAAENVTLAGPYLEVNLNGKKITLCHYPFVSWNGSFHGWSISLHGHTHSSLPGIRGRLDVGVDNAFKLLGEYRPFTLEEVISITEKGSNG